MWKFPHTTRALLSLPSVNTIKVKEFTPRKEFVLDLYYSRTLYSGAFTYLDSTLFAPFRASCLPSKLFKNIQLLFVGWEKKRRKMCRFILKDQQLKKGLSFPTLSQHWTKPFKGTRNKFVNVFTTTVQFQGHHVPKWHKNTIILTHAKLFYWVFIKCFLSTHWNSSTQVEEETHERETVTLLTADKLRDIGHLSTRWVVQSLTTSQGVFLSERHSPAIVEYSTAVLSCCGFCLDPSSPLLWHFNILSLVTVSLCMSKAPALIFEADGSSSLLDAWTRVA